MPDTGWKLPRSGISTRVNNWSGTNVADWTQPDAITSLAETPRAQCDVPQESSAIWVGRSAAIFGSDFGFSIPDDMEVTGVECRFSSMNHKMDGYGALALRSGASIALIPSSSRPTFWMPDQSSGGYKTTTFGGATDRWGVTTIDLSAVNSPSFGVALCFSHNLGTGIRAIIMPSLQVRVHYRNATDQPDTDDPGLYMRNPARTKWQLTQPWFKDPDTGTWRRVRFWKKTDGIWRRT